MTSKHNIITDMKINPDHGIEIDPFCYHVASALGNMEVDVVNIFEVFDHFNIKEGDLTFPPNGPVVEFGRHEELVARGGLYSLLHREQFAAEPRAEVA